MMDGNAETGGSIKMDRIDRSLLQHMITPLCGMDKSPVQLAHGRQSRYTLPLPNDRYKVDHE